MGLFKRDKSQRDSAWPPSTPYGVSEKLWKNGLKGRGEVRSIEQTGMTWRGWSGGDPHPSCNFTIQVMLDDVAPYEATVQHYVPLMLVPQLGVGAVVAVRVNPENHAEIALDLEAAPQQ